MVHYFERYIYISTELVWNCNKDGSYILKKKYFSTDQVWNCSKDGSYITRKNILQQTWIEICNKKMVHFTRSTARPWTNQFHTLAMAVQFRNFSFLLCFLFWKKSNKNQLVTMACPKLTWIVETWIIWP